MSEHHYQCEECGRHVTPSDAIPSGVDDWDGVVVQLYICPECSQMSQFDYDDFIDDTADEGGEVT